MTNWQKFKIISRQEGSGPDFVTFWLDNAFPGLIKDGKILKFREITCFDCSLCNCQIGDYLEIDVDEVVRKNKDFTIVCTDTSMVRKYGSSSSSTNVITTRGSSSDIVISPGAVNAMKSPRTMEIAREMSRIVDETGKEVEFKIEDASSNLKYSLILRKQN